MNLSLNYVNERKNSSVNLSEQKRKKLHIFYHCELFDELLYLIV